MVVALKVGWWKFNLFANYMFGPRFAFLIQSPTFLEIYVKLSAVI